MSALPSVLAIGALVLSPAYESERTGAFMRASPRNCPHSRELELRKKFPLPYPRWLLCWSRADQGAVPAGLGTALFLPTLSAISGADSRPSSSQRRLNSSFGKAQFGIADRSVLRYRRQETRVRCSYSIRVSPARCSDSPCPRAVTCAHLGWRTRAPEPAALQTICCVWSLHFGKSHQPSEQAQVAGVDRFAPPIDPTRRARPGRLHNLRAALFVARGRAPPLTNSQRAELGGNGAELCSSHPDASARHKSKASAVPRSPSLLQAHASCGRMLRLARIVKPIAPKPRIIMAQVVDSGTALLKARYCPEAPLS